MKKIAWIIGGFALGIGASFGLMHLSQSQAQLSERPGHSTSNPIDEPRDLSGLSIKNPRVRVVHTTDAKYEGGSMYMQQADPWLGYEWGRSLSQRNFRERDGVYGDAGKIEGMLLADSTTKMMDRSHTNSCAICHNNPYRDAGAGITMAKNGGSGRNTPHMFGDGLVEMIGLQTRLKLLDLADENRDGWISFEEMKKAPKAIIYNLPEGMPGRVAIDLGSFDDVDGKGVPSLNALVWPYFVDRNGLRIATAKNLHSPDVAGYGIEVQIFGFGHLYLPYRPPVSTTLRSFTTTPFDIHMGLQAHDPTTYSSPKRDGLALVSNAGAQQFISAAGKDRGGVRAPTKSGWPGISLDDPDRDGYCEEISEGEIDVMEWYFLNHPSPTRGKITEDVAAGEKLFTKIGCANCHTPDWHIYPHDKDNPDYTKRYDGDRRFFDLQVAWNDKNDRLEGKVVYLADKKGGLTTPRRGAYTVRGVYSDFKYHDVGEDFWQIQYDGSIIRKWRTPPLWGVGHTAPYAHDGGSLDLPAVIKRHGGEAQESRDAFAALSAQEQKLVVCFLQNLILYQTDQLPCDMDGDGKISNHFKVQGVDTGVERFNPEWLFKVPVKIEGYLKNVQGIRILSAAPLNLRQAYGLDLEFLRDTDGDLFPDVIDPDPLRPGYRDGVR
ncbi:MAG: di-heme oxidoredictase family protein [Gemmataceae bacterium]